MILPNCGAVDRVGGFWRSGIRVTVDSREWRVLQKLRKNWNQHFGLASEERRFGISGAQHVFYFFSATTLLLICSTIYSVDEEGEDHGWK